MKFPKFLALLALLFAGPALAGSGPHADNWLESRLAGPRIILAPRVNTAIVPFVSSALASAPSAFFGPDNALYTGGVNNALKLNGGAAGPFYLPSTTTNPWFVYVEGVTTDAYAITLGLSADIPEQHES